MKATAVGAGGHRATGSTTRFTLRVGGGFFYANYAMSISVYKRIAIALALFVISGVIYFHYLRYTGFALLSEERKTSIIWHLSDRHQWGLARQKPICRDILEHQGYGNVNRTYWTCMAIDLTEKQGWTDLNPIVAAIYAQPKNIYVCQRALQYFGLASIWWTALG